MGLWRGELEILRFDLVALERLICVVKGVFAYVLEMGRVCVRARASSR